MWILLCCHDEPRCKDVCSTAVLHSMLWSGVLKIRGRRCSIEVAKWQIQADMRKQLHAVSDLTIKFHWGRVFSRYTKIIEHNLRAAGIYRVATERGRRWGFFKFFFFKKLRKNEALALQHKMHALQRHWLSLIADWWHSFVAYLSHFGKQVLGMVGHWAGPKQHLLH